MCLHCCNLRWRKKNCGFSRETISRTKVTRRKAGECSESCIIHLFYKTTDIISLEGTNVFPQYKSLRCHFPPAAEMHGSSSYLSSSVCWARSCWAAARAARPCAKLCWEVSDPEPPCGEACNWDWVSARGWGSCPAPCVCPWAPSTGGKGGWKAGEVCCFLPKVLLPLRRVWSKCLLGVLHGEAVKEKNRKHHSFDQKGTN